MSETLPSIYFNKARISSAAALLALSLSACESQSANESSAIDVALEEGLKKLEGRVNMARCELVVTTDADCDGVKNEYDKLPGRADLGDDDGDFVSNAFDIYPGRDDNHYDSDGDGLIDAFDTYIGNNFMDSDGDGIYDAHDLQPSVAAVETTYDEQDARMHGNQIVMNSMANEAFKRYLSMDTSPLPDYTAMDVDSDGDKYYDYFDSEPGNPYVTPKNDVYEVGGDAWYEGGQSDTY